MPKFSQDGLRTSNKQHEWLGAAWAALWHKYLAEPFGISLGFKRSTKFLKSLDEYFKYSGEWRARPHILKQMLDQVFGKTRIPENLICKKHPILTGI